MKFRKIMYEVECTRCGIRFKIPDVSSPVPKHPPKSLRIDPHWRYVPCDGSNKQGNLLGKVTREKE
jgi:hypothetical protein